MDHELEEPRKETIIDQISKSLYNLGTGNEVLNVFFLWCIVVFSMIIYMHIYPKPNSPEWILKDGYIDRRRDPQNKKSEGVKDDFGPVYRLQYL